MTIMAEKVYMVATEPLPRPAVTSQVISDDPVGFLLSLGSKAGSGYVVQLFLVEASNIVIIKGDSWIQFPPRLALHLDTCWE